MRRFISAVCAFVLVFALATPAGAAEKVVFNDEFDTFNTTVWGKWFTDQFGNKTGASLGTLTQLPSALALRPSIYRGSALLYSNTPQITSLPATVKFRVRMSVNDYRALRVWLTPTPGPLDTSGSYIGAHLGESNHNWLEPIHVFGMQSNGQFVSTDSPVKNVIPSDVWLEGTLALTEESAALTWNGSTVTTKMDVASILDETGGLYLQFVSLDDYNLRGFDIDSVTVVAEDAVDEGIAADVRFAPAKLNTNESGGSFAAFVAFEGASAAAVDAKSVRLTFGDRSIPPTRIVKGGKPGTVQIRFDRAAVVRLLGGSKGTCELTVKGALKKGGTFSGSGNLLVK